MKQRSLLSFFALVLALSVPFWLLGATTNLQLMPGLSVSALMALCPMAAALSRHREPRKERQRGDRRRQSNDRRGCHCNPV